MAPTPVPILVPIVPMVLPMVPPIAAAPPAAAIAGTAAVAAPTQASYTVNSIILVPSYIMCNSSLTEMIAMAAADWAAEY